MMDFNNAPPQREFGAVIPDGMHVKLIGTLRRGNASIPGFPPEDAGLFTASKDGTAKMLDWEFEVQGGPYHGSKLWQLWTVEKEGGERDENGASKAGNITKSNIRAMLESATNTRPDDNSAQATAKRTIPHLSALNKIPFAARIGIEPGGARPGGGDYPDKNRLAHIVVPGEAEYDMTIAGRGHELQPKPSLQTARPSAPAAAGAAASWAGGDKAPDPAQGSLAGWGGGNAAPAANGAAAGWGGSTGGATAAEPAAAAAGARPSWVTG